MSQRGPFQRLPHLGEGEGRGEGEEQLKFKFKVKAGLAINFSFRFLYKIQNVRFQRYLPRFSTRGI